MIKIGAIVAINKDRVIGVDGDLPWHYTEDLKRFKRMTSNSVVLMGRKTWESIGSKPLPNRCNIVISRNGVENAKSFSNVSDAIDFAKHQVQNKDKYESTIWIIGGGQIYQSALNHLDFIDLTLVPDELDESKYESVTKFIELNKEQWSEENWAYDETTKLKHTTVHRKRNN